MDKEMVRAGRVVDDEDERAGAVEEEREVKKQWHVCV
jgi:hypothetical protein